MYLEISIFIFNGEKIIDEYQKNISKGSKLISHTNADDMDNLNKLFL